MRSILLLTVLLPWPALADQIDAASRVTAVTLFPYGAQVTRTVDALPGGQHSVQLAGLPPMVLDDPGMLRLLAGPGLQVNSVAVVADPGRVPAATAAQSAARAEAGRRMAAVQAATAEVARLQAVVAAAEARQGFLMRLGEGADLQAANAAHLAGIAAMVGDGVAAAAAAGIDASVALIAAEAALDEAQVAWDAARAAPDAVLPQGGGVILDLVVTVAEGAGLLQVVYLTEGAGWQPVYDLRLTQGAVPSLRLDRGVSVQQATGEDWTDVQLTLSTADLYAQVGPGTLYPDLRRILGAAELERQGDEALGAAVMEDEPMVVASPAPAVQMLGDTVTYVFPGSANLPNGAASLRLSLGEVTLPVALRADAVPRRDMTAFLMASVTNATGETLLPGEATLTRDGALIGAVTLPRMAPGQREDIPFGAIAGLRLTRDMPVRSTGERGVLVASTEMQEVAVLQVENLTDRPWDVRLIDQVPYSEQEDLDVTWSADLPVSQTDIDGQRGVLAWDVTLPPGETRAVTLTTVLEWPEGQVLQ